jgi:hypothetical protein
MSMEYAKLFRSCPPPDPRRYVGEGGGDWECRDHKSLKKWHDLYEKYTDQGDASWMIDHDRLSKFLLRQGRRYTEGERWTMRHWDWIRAQTFTERNAETVFRQPLPVSQGADSGTRLTALHQIKIRGGISSK